MDTTPKRDRATAPEITMIAMTLTESDYREAAETYLSMFRGLKSHHYRDVVTHRVHSPDDLPISLMGWACQFPEQGIRPSLLLHDPRCGGCVANIAFGAVTHERGITIRGHKFSTGEEARRLSKTLIDLSKASGERVAPLPRSPLTYEVRI